MKKKIFITEKPSVAASFGQVLGLPIQKSDKFRGFAENSEYIITWCFGHLVTLAFPDAYDEKYKEWKLEHLPIMPENFIYSVIDNDGTKKQFETIKTLFSRDDVDEILACTDSGREGEYIFRLVYQHSDCNKSARRVWISSHTEESIKDGISKAKDISEYDSLSVAAYSRAREDWLFGMNFSRIYTLQFGWKLSNYLQEKKSSVIAIGRVMTCVLGLVVKREYEIRNFKSLKSYGISATFRSEKSDVTYIGKWSPKSAEKESENSDSSTNLSKNDAEKIVEKLKDKPGEIVSIQNKPKQEQPPFLFNLAELQSEATKKYKIPVDRTLEIAQELYEKKLITYPRTDCKVLSSDVVSELPKILNGLYKIEDFRDVVLKIKEGGKIRIDKKNKRYVDDSKVTDHYAIIPTYIPAKLSSLSDDVKKIYTLISMRFLAAFFPPAKYATTRIETSVDGELFVTSSRVLKEIGWKEVYQKATSEEDTEQDTSIGKLKKGEKCQTTDMVVEEKESKPPARYTDGSLVITMEKAGKFIEDEELRDRIKTCGIGTSATRAGIIKKLHQIGYINIHNKSQVITPTPKGECIVELVGRTAKELLSPSLTASWEKGLFMIEQKQTTEDVFNQKLSKYILNTMDKIKNNKNINLTCIKKV